MAAVGTGWIPIPAPAGAGDNPACEFSPPYEAPPYEPAQKENLPLRPELIDNRDGTLTDPATGLMWAQKDSYADLGKCLDWNQSVGYIKDLSAGNHRDWRIPTIGELASIYDPTQENVKGWDQNPEYPLGLDRKFSDGAAYWYWSSDCGTTELTECCGKTFYFVNGMVHMRRFELCNNGGVRAVRSAKQ